MVKCIGWIYHWRNDLSGKQDVTFESSGGTYTLTVNGTGIYGTSGNTLTINANTTISCANPVSGGSTGTFINNVVINGTLVLSSSANSYLNTTYLTVATGGLLKTAYSNINSDGGWWNAGNSPITNLAANISDFLDTLFIQFKQS